MPLALLPKARTLAADGLSQNWWTSALQSLFSLRPFAATVLSALIVVPVKALRAKSPFISAPLHRLVPSHTTLWSISSRLSVLCCAHSVPKQTRGFQLFYLHMCLRCVPVDFTGPKPWNAILFPSYQILISFGWAVVLTSPFRLLALWTSLEDQSFHAQSEKRRCLCLRWLTIWTILSAHSLQKLV